MGDKDKKDNLPKERWLEAVETVSGWAFLVLGLYALLFVDLSGNGRVWDAVKGVVQDAMPVAPQTIAIHTVHLDERFVDPLDKDQNKMLMLQSGYDKEISINVLDENQPRSAAAMIDAPSDKNSTKDWKKHLRGKLRRFIVYGAGESTTSSSVSVDARTAASGAVAGPAVAPEPAVEASPAQTGASAEARPGISSRVRWVSNGASDSVRNFADR